MMQKYSVPINTGESYIEYADAYLVREVDAETAALRHDLEFHRNERERWDQRTDNLETENTRQAEEIARLKQHLADLHEFGLLPYVKELNEKIAALKADFTQAEESRKTNVLMYERALLDCQRQAEEIAAKCEYINILQRLIKNHAQKCRGWFGIGQDDAWEVMVKALKQEEVFDFNTELEKAFPDSGEEPRTIDGHVVWVKKKQEEVKG